MHPTGLISKAIQKAGVHLPDMPYPPVIEICAITGDKCLCVKREDVLSKAYTSFGSLAAPMSRYIGIDVFLAWGYGYYTATAAKKKRQPERMSSWFCDGETFQEIDRKGVRAKVFQNDMPEMWAGYATTSYKKHGSLVARVNTNGKRLWAFEMRLVDCSDTRKVMEYWDTLNIALRAGIGRSVLETLSCPPFVMGKVGITTWLDFLAWARDKYMSSLYSFMCYLLPSQEELKEEKNNEES